MQRHARLIAMGQTIKALRESKGYSQEGFANEVGLDRSYYGGVERGERNVAALNLMKIAETLGVECGALFPPLRRLAESRGRR